MSLWERDRTRLSAAVWVGVTLAAVVSTAALVAAAGDDRRSLGVATSPFGWNRLILVHTLSTLIPSWWLARTLGQFLPDLKQRWMTVVWCAIGLIVAWLTVVAGSVAELVLDSSQAGSVFRLVWRIAWCLVLQVPWCLMGLAAARRAQPQPAFSPVNLLMLGLVTAVGLPLSFLAVFLEQQTTLAQRYWQEAKLKEATLLVQRLYDVGSTLALGERPVPGANSAVLETITPAKALADLRSSLDFVQKQIEGLASAPASDGQRMQLARYYLSLGRTEEAARVLQPLAETQAPAAILLAGICKEQGRKEEARQWAEKVLELARPVTPARETLARENDQILLQAYDVLTVLAGEEADFDSAERYLTQALERLPNLAADVHHRLGKHWDFVGDLSKSIDHQRQAARLDPKKYPEPEGVLARMLGSGAPVGLARPQSSRYK